jgi:P pilus assembly chaperone PapD
MIMQRHLRLILWLASLAGTGLAGTAFAQVAISPQILDISMEDAAQTQAFRLYNYTNEDKRVRVSLSNWTLDANNEVKVLPPDETSLDRWTVINPVEFDLPAGKSQAVRLAIRPAVPLGPGEHRVMAYFDEIPPADPSKEAPATLRVRFRLGAAVYAHVGPIKRDGTINSVSADKNGFHIGVTTTGNATTRFDGQYVVYPAKAFPGKGKVPAVVNPDLPDMKLPPGAIAGGRVPAKAVLPATTRTISGTYAKPLAAGHYVISLSGHFGDAPLDAQAEIVASGG